MSKFTRTSFSTEIAVLNGDQICALMRAHKKTIRGLAAQMGVSMQRVRDVRTHGISGFAFVWDWLEAIVGNVDGLASDVVGVRMLRAIVAYRRAEIDYSDAMVLA